jgi:hypothetical protein
MADHVLQLGGLGVTYVNLNAFPIHTEDFVPVAAPVTAEQIAAYLRKGVDLDLPPVEQPWTGMICANPGGSPATTVQDNLHLLQRRLTLAADKEARAAGQRIYLTLQVDGTGDTYRSEIFGGSVGIEPGGMRTPWLAQKVKASGTFLRSYYWEKNAVVELPLLNAHGSGTGGITIYNHDDGSHDNFVKIDGVDVAGELPTPLYLRLTNSYNVAAATYNLYAGEYVLHGGTTYPVLVLEGESATGAVPSGPDATCSNDAYGTFTVPATDGQLGYWDLLANLLRTDKLRHFLLVARFKTAPTGNILYARLTFPYGGAGATVLQTDPITAVADLCQTLGTLRIPPWLEGAYGVTLARLSLELWGYVAGGGTLDLDCLELLPLDHWRIYRPVLDGLEYPDHLADEAPTGFVYQDHHAVLTGLSGNYLAQGAPLYVWPGKDSKVIVIADNDAAGCEIDRTHVVEAFHYPRRLTL